MEKLHYTTSHLPWGLIRQIILFKSSLWLEVTPCLQTAAVSLTEIPFQIVMWLRCHFVYDHNKAISHIQYQYECLLIVVDTETI